MKTMTTISAVLVLACAAAHAELSVVATLSTFADLTETIGGEHVDVEYIAAPQFNPHFIEPRPSDVLAVKRADVFVHGGLDLELWREPLLNAAGNARVRRGGEGEIDLAENVRLLNIPDGTVSRAEGDMHAFGNPHFWLAPENAITMAETIARRLSAIDPEHAGEYEENRAQFERNLRQKMADWHTELAPYAGAEVVAYHDQWPYFAEFAGVTIEQFLEPKPGIPPGPRHLAQLESYIEDNEVKAIVYTSITRSKPVDRLSERTGVPSIELAQGVGEVKQAADYIALIEHNVAQLVSVLGGGS